MRARSVPGLFDGTEDAHPPAAPRIGPFAGRRFLEAVWRHTARPGQTPVVLADERGEAVLVEEGGRLELMGHEDLIDYRSPAGDASKLLENLFRGLPPGLGFRFDSLPARAAGVFTAALARAGISYEKSAHSSTAVLELPAAFDDYMKGIGKKERHETRRKRRRFEAVLGPPRLVRHREAGSALDHFFGLHRRSKGRKGSFMTDRMEGFFTDLLAGGGWRLDALYGDGPQMAAAVLGYSDRSGYYLYNSAYDPDLRHASPGVVLLAGLIRAAIDEGLGVFDFLKGEEAYKLRMGARPRPLYMVEGAV